MKEVAPQFSNLGPATAGLLGVGGFLSSLGVSLVYGRADAGAILRAMACMLACLLVGRLLGFAARLACWEHLAKVTADRPIPEVPELRIPEEGGSAA